MYIITFYSVLFYLLIFKGRSTQKLTPMTNPQAVTLILGLFSMKRGVKDGQIDENLN